MKDKKQAFNLVPYMQLLTAKEKAVLCRILNAFPEQTHHTSYHPGILPFAPYDTTQKLLSFAISRVITNDKRLLRQIKAKLTQDGGTFFSGTSSFIRWSMRLDDLKVYRRFGPHPERGKPLPFLGKEKVTVGMKFSLPKRAYVPDKDVLVSPCVTLKRQTQGLWQVEVLARCQHTVEEWLIANCQ